MISQSFLRNYSIKKILTAAAVQKEKLKVYYAKNIRQFFKINDQQKPKTHKQKRSNQQHEVFYRYTVNHMKAQVMKDRKNLTTKQFYRGKPKTVLRCKEITFKNLNQQSQKQQNFIDQKENCLYTNKSFERLPPSRIQTANTSVSKYRRRDYNYRKTVGSFKKHNLENIQTNDVTNGDLYLSCKYDQDLQMGKLNCMENQQIIRCSSAPKIDNFVLFREQTLKKSTERGQKFKQIIRKKYANLGLKRTNWTEIDNKQIVKD